MQRLSGLVVALAAVAGCGAAAGEPPPAAAPPRAALPHLFRVLTAAERSARATAIAATFEPSLRPTVEVDFAGFPRDIELQLATAPAPGARVDLARGVLRAHAAQLGIVDATDLPYEVDGEMLRFGAGARWVGQIVVDFSGAKMTIFGHLWPIAAEPIAVPPGITALVRPFYGKTAQYLSRCLERCGHHDSTEVLDASSFAFEPGVVLSCSPEGVTARAAVTIVRRYRSGARVEGSDALPFVVDARTLAPLATEQRPDYFRPEAGAVVAGAVQMTPGAGYAGGPCFER